MERMKICFLAPAGNYHTEKWSKWFSKKGHEVHVISFSDSNIEGVQVHSLASNVDVSGSDAQKLGYFFSVGKLRKLLKQISPDVLSVHYASSYGAIAAVAGVQPYFLSVWGSDIYDFPRKSVFHAALVKLSLKRANYLLSTSQAMAVEAGKYTDKKFFITPFGVDTLLFSPEKRNRRDDNFVIGTVKSLSPKYGIDYLLKAASIVKKEHPEIPLKIRIAGKGPCEIEYKKLAQELKIDEITTWLGFIPQAQAAQEWANMDLAVIVSTAMESFGVAAVEAQACGVPVIISEVPGLMEATSPGNSSYVVQRKNEFALAEAIVELYNDSDRRQNIGHYGRKHVLEHYSLNKCFKDIEDIFKNSLDGHL